MIYDPCSLEEASGLMGGGGGGGGIESTTAILAVCPSYRESTKRSKEGQMYRVS